MNSENEIILFCQAPSDIQYVLSIYERLNETREISIFVVNVKNSYLFLSELNLNLKKLVFIPYADAAFRNPAVIFRERNRIRRLISTHFKQISGGEVFFFSRFEDWLTAAFVRYLTRTNKVVYLDHYDSSAALLNRYKTNFRTFILKCLYWIITGINFKVDVREKLPEFPTDRFGITRAVPKVDNDVFLKYAFQVKRVDVSRPCVLILLAPCYDVVLDDASYDQTQLKVLRALKDVGCMIIGKGHPRMGIPAVFSEFIDLEIPAYMPIEFVNESSFDLCLGLLTVALSHFSNHTAVPTFSLIDIFKFNNPDSPQQYKAYLDGASGGKMQYFADMDDFRHFLASGFKRGDINVCDAAN